MAPVDCVMSTRMIAQVITPAYPSMNSTYNVSESTLRVRLRIIRLAVTAAAALSPPQQQQQQPVYPASAEPAEHSLPPPGTTPPMRGCREYPSVPYSRATPRPSLR